MAANDRQILEFHARSSGVLADLLYVNVRSLENDFLRLGLEPVPPSRVQLENTPNDADRDSFLAAYRKFDAEYFSFLAACAWCIWHCGLGHSFLPVKVTCRRVLDFCENKREWRKNIWVSALREPERSQLGNAAVENLNTYLALLLDPDFRSQSPLTKERVKQTSARTDAQRTVCMFLLNVFSDATVRNFFEVDGRDALTSHMWTLLESPKEQLRSAGKSYEARFTSVVIKSLHFAGDSAAINERNRN